MSTRTPVRHTTPKPAQAAALAVALVLALSAGACGGARSSSPPSPAATIAKNWTGFFNGQTSAQTKISMLENGERFAAIIRDQASSPMARSASAQVIGISHITATSATVRYDILLGGTRVLTNQRGQAVRQDGTWKVGDASFCMLLALEGARTPSCQTG